MVRVYLWVPAVCMVMLRGLPMMMAVWGWGWMRGRRKSRWIYASIRLVLIFLLLFWIYRMKFNIMNHHVFNGISKEMRWITFIVSTYFNSPPILINDITIHPIYYTPNQKWNTTNTYQTSTATSTTRRWTTSASNPMRGKRSDMPDVQERCGWLRR